MIGNINNIYIPKLSFGTNKITNLCCKNSLDCDTFTKNKEKALKPEIFFIRMKDYDKDYSWANEMVKLTKTVSSMMKNDEEFDEILSYVEQKVNKINYDITQNKYYGTKNIVSHPVQIYMHGRGCEYYDSYKDKIQKYCDESTNEYTPKSNEEYKDANLSTISFVDDIITDERMIYISSGPPYFRKTTNLELIKKAYNKLKAVQNPSLEKINETCAVISWLMVQEMPYRRGSDSIQNILTKAIYSTYNVQISPLKEGKSLDFEAFYSDLDDYIENYPTFFEKPPYKK